MPRGHQPILELHDITKAFGGVEALRGVDFALSPGEIHGLVGENGAGKSTLIKVLAGVYARDAGTISLGGRELGIVTPRLIHELGLRFIHQELQPVPHLPVA
mgnify:CR=1 FL=1